MSSSLVLYSKTLLFPPDQITIESFEIFYSANSQTYVLQKNSHLVFDEMHCLKQLDHEGLVNKKNILYFFSAQCVTFELSFCN